MPHSNIGEKPARIAERQALELQKKNQSYKLVSSESEDEYNIQPKVVFLIYK